MTDITKIPLVSTEISGLWNCYINDTMIVCMIKKFLSNVEDSETRAILQRTSDLSNQHIQELINIFNKEKLTLPNGFNDSDVNPGSPRLFTDSFYLLYLTYTARVQMYKNTLFLNGITRFDIRAFFSKLINENIDLFNNSVDLSLSKGIFIRAPQVDVNKEVEYVKSQSFITDLFGEKRPLLTIEITHIFSNIFTCITDRAVATAFGQVSKDKKVSNYFFEGKTIATKHIDILTTLLTDEGIPIPSTSDSFVTASTTAPFSEKLMMNYLRVMLVSIQISNACISMADSMRSDLEGMYINCVYELMKYSKKGLNLMIDNAWFQQSPQAVNHENLV
jgi:hypothetical protein